MTHPPSALCFEPGCPPDSLPGTLGEIDSRTIANQVHPPGSRGITTLFLTVDVEDAYFNRPILMTGEGIGREYGVFGILDELDARGLKGTFFVNVYEKDRQPQGVVEGVVREVATRGHEVGLHTHPSPVLDFYARPLFRLSREAQVKVLGWGTDLVADWTGEPPTSFRAGGYALNDDTFAALEEVGIKIDSSSFYPSPNNHNTRSTVNCVNQIKEMVGAPVTTVLRADDSGTLHQRKLDVNWLSVGEITAALTALSSHGAHHAIFMMHSFSFIEKQTRRPDEPSTSSALFVSDVHFDRYVEVYGPNPTLRSAFCDFLDHLGALSDTLRIRTLGDALHELRHDASNGKDVVPIVG